jgi:hypothetical protein
MAAGVRFRLACSALMLESGLGLASPRLDVGTVQLEPYVLYESRHKTGGSGRDLLAYIST